MANYTKEYTDIGKALEHDKYEIDGMLGKGKFGHVYKANCKEDGKTYAIKILPHRDENHQKYQLRELELLKRMELANCSNVIKYSKSWFLHRLHESNEQRLCIQMELCSVNLEKFVSKTGTEFIQARSSPRFYQHVLQQILNGLVFIHSIRWVHRDIHPGNILVVNPNPNRIIDIRVKICDFGLARCVDPTIAISTSPQGTITVEADCLTHFLLGPNCAYVAPELASVHYDFKVDMYSVGVVLFFISCYPARTDRPKLKLEIEEIRQGRLDIKECLYHKDDEKLSSLILKLIQEDPKARLSAQQAKDYMFSAEAKDATDANESMPLMEDLPALRVKFLARRENERDSRLCVLNDFTLSALKAEVERRTHVKAFRQVLRHEYTKKDGEKIRIIIELDEDVKNIFEDAAGYDIMIVVIEQDQVVNNTATGQISSGDTHMVSA